MAADETEKICAECGHAIWEGWTSFSTDSENPEKLLMKFGGHIRTPRKFRLPEDLPSTSKLRRVFHRPSNPVWEI